MKLNKKVLMLSFGLASSSTSMAQTFYQCLPCPNGTYVIGGKCKYLSDFVESDFTQIASGSPGSASCPTGTLQPGWYLVKLRGGKGGDNREGKGGNGGSLQYIFYLDKVSSYMLCAGGNGDNAIGYNGGGGGGSWLKLNFDKNDYYFVSGGGAGYPKSYGGGGGGIGGGGGGGSLFASSGNGGRSGPYAGGESGANSAGYPGEGLNKGTKPSSGIAGAAGGGGGGNGVGKSLSDKGGTCPAITIKIITGYKTIGSKTANFGGHATSNITGTSSHSSNTSISGCGSSCAILYKAK